MATRKKKLTSCNRTYGLTQAYTHAETHGRTHTNKQLYKKQNKKKTDEPNTNTNRCQMGQEDHRNKFNHTSRYVYTNVQTNSLG